MFSITEFLIFAATLLFSALIVRARIGKRKDKRRHPPSLPTLPIVGSIPFIRNFENVADFFMKKSSELGPVFALKLGTRPAVVLNTLEAIEDALEKHASSFSGKDAVYADRHIFNRNRKGLALANYNADLIRYKRLSLSILKEFGFGSRSKLEELILMEVDELIHHIKKINGEVFDPNDIIMLSVANVPHNMLIGKRSNYEDGLSELCIQLKRWVHAFDMSLEIFPVLRFLPSHSGRFFDLKVASERLMKTIRKECEEILRDNTSECFVRQYVKKEGPDYDHEQLIYTVRDFLGASLETTSTVMLWLFVYLVNNPHVTERIQNEIDSVIPRERLPSVGDRGKMPYTEATILEVLRLRTPLPLSVPHLTMHDTEVLGYFIPESTLVFLNLKSVHMNYALWPDAEMFRPDRFLNEDNEMINKNRVISFSLGRRACPGEDLALLQLFLFICGLLQNFSLLPPEGIERIDDKINFGVVDCPSPFKLRMIPRER